MSKRRLTERQAPVSEARVVPASPAVVHPSRDSRLQWWQAVAIFVVVLLAVYWPALGGGVLWDDPAHMTEPRLRSFDGLVRIWTEPGVTQQYYPFTDTVFWFQNLLFGQSTVAHHVVNVLLHATAATLLWLLLRDLAIPAAFWIALIWAVHPLQVESVAWITEQKNTLSTIFLLGAFRCYLRFDASRERKWYLWALGLFLLGLASKTVVATLPGALLVVLWWKRGRLDWKRDVVPALPLFALGLLASRVTSHIEWAGVGGQAGADFDRTVAERLIQAGRAGWFYAGKLAWPSDLNFFYPRWVLDATQVMQWVPLVAGLALLGGVWALRGRTRAPLAAVLLFLGTLLPALGFVNVYPFRFSYVADHFQYLAGAALVALAVGGAAHIASTRARFSRTVRPAFVAVAMALAVLAWRQSHLYGGDDIAFYRAILEKNPSAWIAEQNLGKALQAKGDHEGALAHYRAALRIRPDLADVHFDEGAVLYAMGRRAEAATAFAEGVRLWPWYAKGRFNYGAALAGSGERERAIAQFDTAAAMEPDSAAMQEQVANAYLSLGDTVRAMQAVQRLMRLRGQR